MTEPIRATATGGKVRNGAIISVNPVSLIMYLLSFLFLIVQF